MKYKQTITIMAKTTATPNKNKALKLSISFPSSKAWPKKLLMVKIPSPLTNNNKIM